MEPTSTAAAERPHSASPTTNPVTVILNRSSGSVGRWKAAGRRELIRAAFFRAGLECDIFVVKGEEITAAARKAARTSARIVVAAGGDGTVSAVAAELIGSEKLLGILPMGTLNHFAKDAGIPLALDTAAEVIASGHAKELDVGEVNGRIFINNSSIGLYPQMVQGRERQRLLLGRGKWLAMFRAGLRVFRRFAQMTVTLDVAGRQETHRTPLLFVGNNRYELAGLTLGARPALDRGELCLYVTTTAGRFAMIRLVLLALMGRLHQARDFKAIYGTEFTVNCDRRRVRVAFDGETEPMQLPLKYRSHARAIRVLVAPPAARGEGLA